LNIKRVIISRKGIIAGSIAIGLALIIVGFFLPQVAAGYLAAVALQIGSTFFLIPLAVWIEGKLTSGLEEIRLSLNEESRASKAAGSIGLDSRWEDVVPAFDRVRLRAYTTVLYVKLLNVDVWLGFGMWQQFMLGEDFTPVHIYFTDPNLEDRPRSDSSVQWNSGITGRQLMEKVAGELQQNNRFPGRELFQPAAAFEQLREQVTRIVEGQDPGSTPRT
jgi:hypothetical protein